MKLKLIAIAALVTAIIVAASWHRRVQSFNNPNTPASDQPTSADRAPVLVELFTSEGCSSCPPADELLARLDQSQPINGAEIIALSEHVDYWNHLGWADPFSSKLFSERQSVYGDIFHRDDIYTPQMIVDGKEEFTGGDANHARQAIETAARAPKAHITLALAPAAKTLINSVPITVNIDNLPEISKGDRAEVVLAIAESGLRSNVQRGENSGRQLSHTAVTRRLTTIGVLNAQQPTFTTTTTAVLARAWQRNHLKAVVFVQEHHSRRVLGVAAVSLAKE